MARPAVVDAALPAVVRVLRRVRAVADHVASPGGIVAEHVADLADGEVVVATVVVADGVGVHECHERGVGRGAAVGMLASFPLLANGTANGGAPLTKLNRYTLVTDVLVPESTLTSLPNYLDLFQPRGNGDGSLFVRKPSQQLGAAVSYGGQIAPNTWYRIAMVMQLDAATSAPRYETYIDGQPIGQIVWDQIVVDSNRNADLKDFDLVPDGLWSIAALSETQSSLPANASGFFAFNDDSGEVGELYVANMQFRDDALSAASVAALGGAAAGPIAVPEPAGWLLIAAGVACASRFPRRCCHTSLDFPPR